MVANDIQATTIYKGGQWVKTHIPGEQGVYNVFVYCFIKSACPNIYLSLFIVLHRFIASFDTIHNNA